MSHSAALRPSWFTALTLLGLTTACASQNAGAPAWPEQPNPSYPTPGDEAPEKPDASLDTPDAKDPGDAKSSSLAKEYEGKKAKDTLKGEATYYADSLAGNHTANGDVYDPAEFTAAHKKLPFGTIVRVVREDTGRATYVRINDRGPFGPAERIIDVSKAAAKELDMMKAGVVSVRVEVLETPAK